MKHICILTLHFMLTCSMKAVINFQKLSVKLPNVAFTSSVRNIACQ